MATIKQALAYPFVNFARLWNFWWFLVPIWGWFIVNGYIVRICSEIKKGKSEELPAIRPFKGLFSQGFFLTVALIVPGLILFLLFMIHPVFWLLTVYFGLISPILILQFSEKNKVRDGMNVFRATKMVFTHLGAFLLTWLKMLVVTIIWVLASVPIITLLVTLPTMQYGQYRLFTDFYVEASTVQKKKDKAERRKAIERDIAVSISFKKGGK